MSASATPATFAPNVELLNLMDFPMSNGRLAVGPSGAPVFEAVKFTPRNLIEKILDGTSHFDKAHLQPDLSLLNNLSIQIQCMVRGIRPGPAYTMEGWNARGRRIRKGQQALWVNYPVKKVLPVVDRDGTQLLNDDGSPTTAERVVGFEYRKTHFVLSQTWGDEFAWSEIPTFDLAATLKALDIEAVPFDMERTVLGFARKRQISVSPLSGHPLKTAFHEIAHVILGHTAENPMLDGAELTRTIGEAEAESTAFLCLLLTGQGDEDAFADSRAYLKEWLGRDPKGVDGFTEGSARRVFRAADTIVRALVTK